jgi:carbamoyltransferase
LGHIGTNTVMRILGIHGWGHDIAAALFDDYNLIAAVQEERLTRIKSWGGGVPWLAIEEVLGIAGWNRRDIDVIALGCGTFPTRYLRFSLGRDLYYTMRRWFGRERPTRDIVTLAARRGIGDPYALFRSDLFLADHSFRPDTKICFQNHHEAHALAALFHTDWDDALVYTSDGVGDNVSYSVRCLKGGRLDCHLGGDMELTAHPYRNSIATAYMHATVACGFRPWRHEGKLTGLSARGKPTLTPELARHFWTGPNGVVKSDFKDWRSLEKGVRRVLDGHDRETIAASIQQLAEDVILSALQFWIERSGMRRLALCGGLFANVRLNRLLAESLPLDEIFIFPAMGDDGLAVGNALAFLLHRDGLTTWLSRRRRLDDMYLGRDYDGVIDECLGSATGVKRHGGDPAGLATDLIRAGKVGAIYVGRMEYGPRALGSRSIIASPHDHAINDNLNKRLERSEFMPFAPYILDEDAARVFEITPVNHYAAHFMTITCAVRPEWRDRIPAVVHIDGTARPQIIRNETNPLFAGILRRFRDATGLPVLVNTSFNVHEEPIVNRPSECLRALLDGRVDFVVTNEAVYTTSRSVLFQQVD